MAVCPRITFDWLSEHGQLCVNTASSLMVGFFGGQALTRLGSIRIRAQCLHRALPMNPRRAASLRQINHLVRVASVTGSMPECDVILLAHPHYRHSRHRDPIAGGGLHALLQWRDTAGGLPADRNYEGLSAQHLADTAEAPRQHRAVVSPAPAARIGHQHRG